MSSISDLRERLGRRVREVWVEWAKRQQNAKQSWLIPYDELSEPDKEVDRCIGSAIWGDCVAEHATAIAEYSVKMVRGEGGVMSGAQKILAERCRQITQEGWTPEHDDKHIDGALAKAAQAYLNAIEYVGDTCVARTSRPSFPWPWDAKWWKPSSDNRKNLIKAGALIAAEIDRLDRLELAKREGG